MTTQTKKLLTNRRKADLYTVLAGLILAILLTNYLTGGY